MISIDFKDEETSKKLIEIAQKYQDGVDETFEVTYYAHGTNIGVGKSKNFLLKYLMDKECDHLFLMEDDITMLQPTTCEWYIQCAKDYGVEHLNFAHHGPANVGRKSIEWFKGKPVLVHPHCVGAFSYYTRNCIEKVGYMDEEFHNVFEHIDLTKRIIDAGMHPEFWMFADAMKSEEFLREIPGSIEGSSIRNNPAWEKNMKDAYAYWMKKYGKWIGNVKDVWN
jgi:GT2 family glycosyltransferase